MTVTDPATTPAAISLGARLREARERCGMSKQQVADKLHCDTAVIDALESDNYQFLGAPVYVRGHVRRYAELVGESPAEAQQLYSQLAAQVAAAPDLTRIAKGERPADPRSLIKPLIGVGVTLLIAATAWWVLKGKMPHALSDVVPLENASTAPVAAETSAVQAGSATPGASIAAAAPAGATASSATVSQEPASVAAAPTGSAPSSTTSTVAAAASGALQLRVTTDSDCWIEVHDGKNRRIYFGTATPGSVQQIAGSAPLRVLLGNIRTLKLEINGRPTPIPESVRRGTAASFAVMGDGQIRPVPEAAQTGGRSAPRAPRDATQGRGKRP